MTPRPPSITTAPASAACSPQMMRSSVVLPAPFGPTSALVDPDPTRNATSSSSGRPSGRVSETPETSMWPTVDRPPSAREERAGQAIRRRERERGRAAWPGPFRDGSARVVRRLDDDLHVVRVRLLQARRRDAHELALALQLVDRARADVEHRLAQA